MKHNGLNRRKWIIYGTLAALLVVANVVRWQTSDPSDVVDRQVMPGQAPLGLPVLQTADDFTEPADFQRDLFLKHTPIQKVVVVPVQIEEAPIQPDPMDLLRKRANVLLDGVELQGIMSTPNGPVAMLRFDGVLLLARNGEELIPGYTIVEISHTQLRVENKILDIQRLYMVGEADLK